MSAPLGKCCVTGAIHSGESVGEIKEFDGVPTYVTIPKGDYDKTKALLFLPDIFGFDLINAKLLADSFSANGYATYIPDYLNKDPVPAAEMEAGKFDLGKWFPHHGPDVTRPLLDKVIAVLKKDGVKEFAATGYCFGARYVVDLAFDKEIKVAIVAHPSLLKVPDDLEKLKSLPLLPILFNTCETDGMFPLESQKKADEILGGEKNYKRNYYAGCSHGFAVRGDLSDPVVKAAKENAFEQSVSWLKEHF
ncbi:alpha/beta-hydrolase [Pseudohyphozyma bogoriensis]|nr:alpha/beta-hydrolase [Pseudohyphozyma bogoriensis]